MKEINREHFEHWLFSQPLSRSFDYTDVTGKCAICAFVREMTNIKATGGAIAVSLGPLSFDTPQVPMPDWLLRATNGVLSVDPINAMTISAMQRQYLKLFPDTDLSTLPRPNLSDEPAEKPTIVLSPKEQQSPTTGSQLASSGC